ncbi:MAG: flotillin-like FloA family protein [Phycisphaerae bacterium]|nr:flotillin-like FloA family protein [Phycisphaerae bacterium]
MTDRILALGMLALREPRADGSGIPFGTIILVIIALLCLLVLASVGRVFNLWLHAFWSQADVSMHELIGMYFRKVDARMIVLQKIRAVSAGIPITTEDLVRHCLAGGNVEAAVSASIAARRAGVEMSFQKACDVDLAGHDVVKTVQQMTSGVASL